MVVVDRGGAEAKAMNVYDFDGTIFKGDSSKRFYFFCLWHNPQIALLIPVQLAAIAAYRFHLCSLQTMKEVFFSYLGMLRAPEQLADMFCEHEFNRIVPWYLAQKKGTDLVVSASPEFLVGRFCRRLGLRAPLCTQMDIATGHISGNNCKGDEKLSRFRRAFPSANIDEFYSDSLSDSFMARAARRSFLVDNRKGSKVTFPLPE